MTQLYVDMRLRAKCGSTVVINQRALAHLQAHPDVQHLLPEAISRLTLAPKPLVAQSIDFERVIGKSALRATEPATSRDCMQFAVRKGRTLPSRVVHGECIETSEMYIVAKRMGAEYALITAFLGGGAEKEPWDATLHSPRDQALALDFWCQHALVYEPQLMGEVFESSWHEVLNSCEVPA